MIAYAACCLVITGWPSLSTALLTCHHRGRGVPSGSNRRSRPLRRWGGRCGAPGAAAREAVARTAAQSGRVAEARRRMDDALGGGTLLPAVREDLRLVVAMLKNAAYSEEVGKRLHAVAAEFGRLAGWLAEDCDRPAWHSAISWQPCAPRMSAGIVPSAPTSSAT